MSHYRGAACIKNLRKSLDGVVVVVEAVAVAVAVIAVQLFHTATYIGDTAFCTSKAVKAREPKLFVKTT